MRENFAGRIFQTRDVVQVVMVKLIIQGLKRVLQVSKIHHPPLVCHQWAFNVHRNAKAVAVQPTALVCGWHIRQAVRRFKRELAKNFHSFLVVRTRYGRGDLGPI